MKKTAFLLVALSGGGGERVMLDVANVLSAKGIPVDFLLLDKKGPYLKEVDSHVNIIHFSVKRMFGALFPLALYLVKERPHTLIATSIHMQVLALLAKIFVLSPVRIILRIGIPLSFRFSTLKSGRDRLVVFLAKALFPRMGQLVANSVGIARDGASELGISKEHFNIIYNPKDLSYIQKKSKSEIDHPWFKEKTTPIVVGAGRLREQKDFKTLIKAFAELGGDAKLIILGIGSELPHLKSIARKCGVGNRVDFVGFVNNPYTYFSRADVFVLSSIWEGFPNTLLEAMACGTPVISTDCPYGSHELLAPSTDIKPVSKAEHAEYGILVPMKKPNLLAHAMGEILSSKELQDKYKKKSLERAADFSMEYLLPQYEKVLDIK